jgi:hypothetical protein
MCHVSCEVREGKNRDLLKPMWVGAMGAYRCRCRLRLCNPGSTHTRDTGLTGVMGFAGKCDQVESHVVNMNNNNNSSPWYIVYFIFLLLFDHIPREIHQDTSVTCQQTTITQ